MPRYDTLHYSPRANRSVDSGRDGLDTTSTFLDNYQYARRTGMTHVEAHHYAIDYHRKFTAREATDNWDDVKGSFMDEGSLDAIDQIAINETLGQIVRAIRIELIPAMAEKMLRFLFLTLRKEDVDQHMNEALLLECVTNAGDCYPDEVKDIAAAMGFVIRPNGSCNSMTRYRKQLQEICVKHGAVSRPAERRSAAAPVGAGPFSMVLAR
jgi:hypothetical protein